MFKKRLVRGLSHYLNINFEPTKLKKNIRYPY